MSASPVTAEERRRSERFPSTVPTVLRVGTEGLDIEGVFPTTNLSTAGLCLDIEPLLSPGQAVRVDLLLPGEQVSRRCNSVVRWVHPVGGQPPRHRVGLELSAPPPDLVVRIRALLDRVVNMSRVRVVVRPAPARADTRILELEGFLDASTRRALEVQVDELKRQAVSHVVVDFGRLRFVNSSCMGVLLGLAYSLKSRAGSVRFAAVPESVRCVIEQVGLHEVFETRPTVADALASL